MEIKHNLPTEGKVRKLFKAWFRLQGNKITWKEFINSCSTVPDVTQDDAFLGGFAEGYKWHASLSASTRENPEQPLS